MLNKLMSFIREREMISSGDKVICAVSGGTDSVALLFALYLLKEKLDIGLEAAHFNHRLRGEESDRDEAFVRKLCDQYDIPLHVGSSQVVLGKKGLEAAARDARYAFLRSLPGKIATAHTADDNAETVLMHLIRGTRLKGLGGIAPISDQVIRPMLTVTRRENEEFLEQWHLPHREDSSNHTDQFLRNRLRRHVMPLLTAENPRLAENLSQMALGLRSEEAFLSREARNAGDAASVEDLRAMPAALRSRALEGLLKESGVKEPEDAHIALAESLVFSDKPSARANFPGGVILGRSYDRLTVVNTAEPPTPVSLPCPGETEYGDYRVICIPAAEIVNTADTFTVSPHGKMVLSPRQSGDKLRLPGGEKSLKKLFIDRKIPASQRPFIPVLRDEQGVLGVYSIGVHRSRVPEDLPGAMIRFIKKENEGE